jgi:hypothetical protein
VAVRQAQRTQQAPAGAGAVCDGGCEVVLCAKAFHSSSAITSTPLAPTSMQLLSLSSPSAAPKVTVRLAGPNNMPSFASELERCALSLAPPFGYVTAVKSIGRIIAASCVRWTHVQWTHKRCDFHHDGNFIALAWQLLPSSRRTVRAAPGGIQTLPAALTRFDTRWVPSASGLQYRGTRA